MISQPEPQAETKVSVEALSALTGFPREMIQEELLEGRLDESISLNDLRQAMLNLIDSTLLQDAQK
jgi:hypothetical protein